jgi:outer membrane protein assembly factor BamD
MKFNSIILIVLLALFAGGCSEYSKILKEKDTNKKYDAAVQYYKDGECHKALPLLEELIGLTRGTQRAEDVYYYYSQCHYCIKDYYLGNYYFKNFTKTFSYSDKAESCLFMAALCSYNLSPEYSLDQADTHSSIEQFQLFLDTYPNSALRDSANHMIEKLNYKLEKKDYENAKIFYQTLKYKAAVFAMKKFMEDYPESRYREEMMYLIVSCHYEYAKGSIDEKKLERYRAATESYLTFATAFPNSPMLREAEFYYLKALQEIDKLKLSQKAE